MSAFMALNGSPPRSAPRTILTSEKPAERVNEPSPGLDRRPSATQPNSPDPPRFTPPRAGTWLNHERAQPDPPPPPPQVDREASFKRKRSTSLELLKEPPTARAATSEAPNHVEHQRYARPVPRRDSEQHAAAKDQHPLDKEPSWHAPSVRDDRDALDTQRSSAASSQAHTDDHHHIECALRHAATAHVDQSDGSQASPEPDDRSVALFDSPYAAAEHPSDSLLQHDPKKRKRNFSNRTKTGCLTCRKRKKKCDEQKPQCSNCIRGGFVCAGYPPQRGASWQKPEGKAQAVPLESKDPSYVPPGAYGMPHLALYAPHQQPVKREPPAAAAAHYHHQHRRQVLRIDPPQGRTLAAGGSDDDRPTGSTIPSASAASAASPENKLSSSAAAVAAANVFPTPVSANTQPPPFADKMPKDYQRVPSLHDLARTPGAAPDPSDTQHPVPPHLGLLHPTRRNSPTTSLHAHAGSSSSSSAATAVAVAAAASNAQVAAQLALSHPQYRPPPRRRTQKEEMLAGRHYYPFDKELCLERERCAVACWKFNSLTAPPTHGVSADERTRLFLDILQPRDPVRLAPASRSPVANLGRLVSVEAPFTCDYGYNISLGNHVVVGRSCTFNDVCEVKIGDNCVIGPNVTIYTAFLPIDPNQRQGGQGPQLGKPVTIEPDCWIGGGATILPGRTVGKGSTVGAGSIVTKDVSRFTVVAGNPARVLRGAVAHHD